MPKSQMTQPRICDYEGASYRTDFWEDKGREYEDRVERIVLLCIGDAGRRRLVPHRPRDRYGMQIGHTAFPQPCLSRTGERPDKRGSEANADSTHRAPAALPKSRPLRGRKAKKESGLTFC